MTLESMNKKFLFKEWIWELILTHTRNMILVHLDEANNLEYIKHGGDQKEEKKNESGRNSKLICLPKSIILCLCDAALNIIIIFF